MEDTQFIEIQRLCRIVHERGLSDLAVTRPDFSISLKAMERGVADMQTMSRLTAAPAEAAPAPDDGHIIPSPLVGIFFRTPTPDAPAFVEVGDMIEIGQTIGIVESMKVFNEITADCAGVVTAIPALHGKLVQVGQPLIVLDPLY